MSNYNSIDSLFKRNETMSNFINDMKYYIDNNDFIEQEMIDSLLMIKKNKHISYNYIKENYCIALMRNYIESFFENYINENPKYNSGGIIFFNFNFFNKDEKKLIENVLVRIVLNKVNEKIMEVSNEN